MARLNFGGTSDDYVFMPVTIGTNRLQALAGNIAVTFWTAQTSGTQITDLIFNGSPATSITTVAGQLPEFQGPDGVNQMWADAGAGRVLLFAQGLQGPVGPTGPSIAVWAASTAYTAGQVVSVGAVLYKSNDNHTSAATFGADSSHWTVIGPVASVVGQTGAVTGSQIAADAALSSTYALTQDQTVHTSAFTATANTIHTLDSTSSSVAVTLPTAPADRVRVVLKDLATAPNGATFTCGGSDVINKPGGSTSGSLKLAAQAVTIQYDATRAVWVIVGDDLPLTSMDARYPQPAGKTTPVTTAAAKARAINVKDYGCVADGGTGTPTDNRVNARAAAAAAGALGVPLYFPPGIYAMSSSPTDNMCLVIPSGIPEIFGDAATIKLIDNNPGPSGAGYGASTGNYSYILSGYTNDITGTHIHHLTFDGNNRNSGNTVQDANFIGPSGSTPRAAINWNDGKRVKITDCRFTDFDSTWLITNAKPGTAPAGTVSDVVIERNVADNIGSTVIHDHSSLYIDSDGMYIAHNAFHIKGTAYYGARTAIETHGPRQFVHDNYVYGYANGSFCCSGSVALGASSYLSGSWHDNHFYGVGIGIQLRADASTGTAIQDFTCHDNVTVADFGTWHSYTGQNFGSSGVNLISSSTAPIRDVQIKNNHYRLTNFTSGVNAADVQSAGIYWQRTSGTPVDNNIVIEGNISDGSGANSIYFAGAPAGTHVLSISNNICIDPGQAVATGGLGSASAAAIFVGGLITEGRFHRNFFLDDQGTHTMVAGLDVSTVLSGSARLSAHDNEIRVADGTFGTSVSYVKSTSTGGMGIDVKGQVPVATGSWFSGNLAAGSQIRSLGNGALYVTPSAGGFSASMRIAFKSDAKGTVAAQSGAGTSPPTPTWTGRDWCGSISWGTGTSPSAGSQVTATFGGPDTSVVVVLTPLNAATAALQPYIASASSTAFTIATAVAPSASQAAGTYSVGFLVEELA